MQNISSSAGLKEAIQLLEIEQASYAQLLKEEFHLTYESFKAVNLLRSTLHDIASSPNLINNILGTVTGLTTGYLSKKIFIGASGNLFRKLIGNILQVGITSAVAKHPEAVKSFGQLIFEHLLRKKETNSESRDR